MARIIADDVSIVFPVMGADRSFRKEIIGKGVGGLLGRGRNNETPKTVTALKNFSIDLNDGDRLALIGHNGAGKTTTLRMLLGNYWPTEGELHIDGDPIPLLGLGLGMDPDFSGLENIGLCGRFVGMSNDEIDANFDDICGFSELGGFLKLPIRTYSAGMLLRLTYAIVTAANPDILLLDEIFGTGDASFYAKARQRMEDLLGRTNILVFASHSMQLIREQCNMACVMQHGTPTFVGDLEEGIAHYMSTVTS